MPDQTFGDKCERFVVKGVGGAVGKGVAKAAAPVIITKIAAAGVALNPVTAPFVIAAGGWWLGRKIAKAILDDEL